MSKLLSDEELCYKLEIMAMTTTQNQVVLLSKDQVKELLGIINTQKRLYADERERKVLNKAKENVAWLDDKYTIQGVPESYIDYQLSIVGAESED